MKIAVRFISQLLTLFKKVRGRVFNWFMRLPLTKLTMVAFSIVILLTLISVTMIFYFNSRKLTIKTIYDSNYIVLNELIKKVDNLSDMLVSLSFYVSSNNELKRLLTEFPTNISQNNKYQFDIRNLLNQFWINKSEIVGISVYTDKLETINSQTIAVSSISFPRDMGWLDILGAQRGIIICDGRIYKRGSSGTPFGMLSIIKIPGNGSEILGYLSFEITETYLFNELLEQNIASPSSVIMIVDKNNIIISHNDKALIGKKLKEVYPLLSSEKIYGITPKVISQNKTKYIPVRSRSSEMELSILELISVSEVYSSRNSVLVSLIVTVTVAMLISLSIIWIISVRISRPIVSLSQIMRSGSLQGSLSDYTSSNVNNEIGILYKSYNKMIDRINKLMEQQKYFMNTMRRAEISALQAQINPHFVYNSLDYINWMAQESNVPDISVMLTNLSSFMRNSLSDSNVICTLRTEIEHVSSYLEIFKVRYTNYFKYKIDVDSKILEYYVPKLILQPLVENSIIHGFEHRIKGAEIDITIKNEEDFLFFTICDNGKGMSSEILQEALSEESDRDRHYGLKNVNDRIQYITNDNFSGLILIPRDIGTCIRFSFQSSRNEEVFEV